MAYSLCPFDGKGLAYLWEIYEPPEAGRLATYAFLFITALGAILLIVGLALFLWRMLNYKGYTIQQFSVPKELDENGVNPTVIARQLEDHYLHLKDIARSIKEDSIQAVGDEQQPDFPLPWLRKVYILRELDRDEEAIAFFKRTTELRPKESNYWNAYGTALFFFDRYEEADAAFAQAEEHS